MSNNNTTDHVIKLMKTDGSTVVLKLRENSNATFTLDGFVEYPVTVSSKSSTSEGGGGSNVVYTFTGGLIETNGIVTVDVGTTAGKIVRVGSDGKLPLSILPAIEETWEDYR